MTIPVSVEAHHALMDGLHVARYLEQLQHFLAEPETALFGGGPAAGIRAT